MSESNLCIFESVPELCFALDIVWEILQGLVSIFFGEQLFIKSDQRHSAAVASRELEGGRIVGRYVLQGSFTPLAGLVFTLDCPVTC
jgi:hypothetical protein